MILLSSCATGSSTTEPAGDSPTHTRTPVTTSVSPTAPSTASDPEASIPAHETPGSATSERGLPLYAPGEALRLEGSEGKPVITLTVTSLSVEDTCPVDGGRPANGAFALVEVEATFEKASDADAPQRPLMLSPDVWAYYPVDGPRYDGDLGSAAATSCQQAGNALPAELKAGSTVRGTLVLDIPERTGALTLADADTDIAEWPLP